MVSIEQIVYVVPILALTASIFYYAMVIQNQNKTRQLQLKAQEETLETRKTQLYMDLYSTIQSQDFGTRLYTVINWTWEDFDDFESKYGIFSNQPENASMWTTVAATFMGAVRLELEGKIDFQTVKGLVGPPFRLYWEKMGEIIKEYRTRHNMEGLFWTLDEFYERITNS